jgi:hypothetical protein
MSSVRNVALLLALPTLWLACKRDERQSSQNKGDRVVIEAQIRLRDCDTLRSSVEAAQKRLAQKAEFSYSKKAFQELASMRDAVAKEAGTLTLAGDKAVAIRDAWQLVNTRAAAAERRAAESIGGGTDASPADATAAASELSQIGSEEDKVLADLNTYCRR